MKIVLNRWNTPTLDISDYQIVYALDAYRYVNHTDKILTTGFNLLDGLTRNADCILATDDAITRSRERYKQAFDSD